MSVIETQYRGFRVTRGDATGEQLAILVPTGYRVLHFASAADEATDWAVANPTHPTFYVHSETTPETDYVAISHDGTTGLVTSVGGTLSLNGVTNVLLQVGGTSEVTLTATALSPSTSGGNALGTTALMWGNLFLASAGVINFNNGNVTLTHAAGFLTVNDNVGLRIGTTGDDVLYHKTTTTNANTALTSVLIGTPVSQALAADSLIVSNVTASGDIGIYVNNGGNSLEVLMADASAGTAKIGHGLAGLTLSVNSGSLTLDSVAQMTFQIGAVDILALDDAAISGFAGAADTAGQNLYIETEDGGAAGADTAGVAGGLYSLKAGDGSAGGAHTSNNPAGGVGGALTFTTGIGGVSGAAGSGNGGAGGALTLAGGAGGAVAGDGTGTGGEGGDVLLSPGAGGGAGGGTAGRYGYVEVLDGRVLYIGVSAAPGTTQAGNWIGLEDSAADPVGTLTNSLAIYTPDGGDSLDFLHADGTTDSLGT